MVRSVSISIINSNGHKNVIGQELTPNFCWNPIHKKFYTLSCMTAHSIDEIYTCDDAIRIAHLMMSRCFSLVTHSLQLSLCSLLTSTHTSLSRAENSSDFQGEMTRVRLYKVFRTSDKRSHDSSDKLYKQKAGCQLVIWIGYVNEYLTMHYFRIPRHSVSDSHWMVEFSGDSI